MNSNRAFSLTRQRLAVLYAGTMGLILAASGFSLYHSMAHERWQSLNRKIETFAGTLHDGIEPALEQPGVVEPVIDQFLPGLMCLNSTQCPEQSSPLERHIAGVTQQENYYVRFIDMSGKVLAAAGQKPEGLPPQANRDIWQTLEATNGTPYRQISLFLKTQDQVPWGYLQIGQSLEEYENYLAQIRWTLTVGFTPAILLVTGASWWLSGVAMRPAYQAYQQMQQFTADAAHELRTPIATIQSTVEFTLDEPELSTAEAHDTLRIIDRQNNRLSTLVQDLLLLSRIDLQSNALNLEICCLNSLLEELVEDFSGRAIAANLTLKTDIKTSAPLMVLGNEEQLYRLFSNLIANAIHYTPPRKPPRKPLIIHMHEEERDAVISVQDTGIGIPSAEQSLIFNRFYRVNSDRSRQTGGIGLGLSIAQAIALAHHGTIQVKSELGIGSTFTIRLPLKLA